MYLSDKGEDRASHVFPPFLTLLGGGVMYMYLCLRDRF